jgi:glycosyltransferase involved in cell wall biosynthesis
MQCVPPVFRNKTVVQLAVSSDTELPARNQGSVCALERGDSEPTAVLYVGRFLYWKGLRLALEAFTLLNREIPSIEFTLVGRGPYGRTLKRLSKRMGIADRVKIVDWVPQSQLPAIYGSHDVLLFPSLHDSGGLVVLEALASGVPVVCLDLGGPGVIVDDGCGRKIPVEGLSSRDVVERLFHALKEIAGDRQRFRQLVTRNAPGVLALHSWRARLAAAGYRDLVQ